MSETRGWGLSTLHPVCIFNLFLHSNYLEQLYKEKSFFTSNKKAYYKGVNEILYGIINDQV